MAADPSALADLAYHVADEYRAGRLDRLTGRTWAVTWQNLVDELQSRLPGFTDAEYAAALDQGFVDSR